MSLINNKSNPAQQIGSAAGGTDTGIAILAVRDDALSTLTPAEGDYSNLHVNSTGALHVTGGGGGTQYAEDASHTTGDTGTLALVVRNDTLAALAGTDGDYSSLQVNASGALYVEVAAGTNAIGKLSANSGVDIGDVDVTSIVPLTGATNLGKAVDSVAGATDTGIAILAVRDDTPSTLTPAEGDYANLKVDEIGSLYTHPTNIVSTVNSTTSTLAADASFTGTAEIVSNYTSFTLNVTSDVNSAKNGLCIQFSSDGTNWDIDVGYTIDNDVYRTFTKSIKAKYFRVIYTNGRFLQSHFRLQTIFHSSKSSMSKRTFGVDAYKEKKMGGMMIGAIATKIPRTLVNSSIGRGIDNIVAPIQVNGIGELRTDGTITREMNDTLKLILIELRKNNLYNAMSHGEELKESDVTY